MQPRRDVLGWGMFHLIVTLCLSASPATCAARLLPAPLPETRAECESRAPARIAGFAAAHGLIPRGWDCRTDPPAAAMTEIAPGVFSHTGALAPLSPANGGDIANLSFILTDQVTVIDAGGSRAGGEALFAAIRARTDAPITAVILTHGHPDHSLGAAVFAEAGAEVIGHVNLPAFVAARAETWARSIPAQIGAAPMIGAGLVLPDRVIAVPTDLPIGQGQVLRLTPEATAHTNNDMTAFHPASGILFTGDLVFHGLTPVLDGSLTGWLAWLARDPGPEVARIVPGHGHGPFGWAEGTAPIRAYLTGLADQTRAAIAAGIPMGEATAADASALSRMPDGTPWAGFAEMHPRNATAAYAELEWE